MKSFHQTILLAAVMCLSATISGQAQSAANSLKGPQKSVEAQSLPADSPAKLKDDFIKATEEYKTSLKDLIASYQSEVQKQSERAEKLKALYDDGLISRREFEESENGIAEARVKVEEAKNQLAAADLAIAEAKKQPVFQPYTRPAGNAWRETVWTTGNARVDSLIRQNGERYGVDPYLIFCVMEQESHFNQYIVSPKGAMGLMQLMPGTAVRFGVLNPYDPAQNIMAGTRYLKGLMQMFGGRVELVLASYNAGEGAVIKFGQRIPPYRETLDYVRLISARYWRQAR
ncbi:MAG TPA: lytic transglycosylase domain-containing protein [Pyrinomonadaceae bacterium]|jgi:soluble lytic murein transglycosylase-like protein|nr:lytic transglycosylase domain-containing protein [Pyrinomonadaceae bacterium]